MKAMRCALPLLFLATGLHAGEETRRFYGYVTDLESGRYVYTELYEQRFTEGVWTGGTTRYLDANGEEFATKSIEFGADRFVPVYRLEQPRQKYVEGITDNGKLITMVRREGDDEDRETVERDGLMAADAGLPRLLLDRFDKLLAGKELEFGIVAPGRLDTYRFRARRIADASFEGQPAVVVQVDLDSMLNLFTGPLRFAFDAKTRDLREYTGTTNLRDPDGELYVVRVRYGGKPPEGAPELPPLQ